jgi:hypothetical protein
MELEARLAELAKVISDHREVLLTEEAAKNALVMPLFGDVRGQGGDSASGSGAG